MPTPRRLSSGYVARFGEAKARLCQGEEALASGELLLCDHHLLIALAQIRTMRGWLKQALDQTQEPIQ